MFPSKLLKFQMLQKWQNMQSAQKYMMSLPLHGG